MLQFRRPGWQKHKVAPEGKGLAARIAARWASLWSITVIDTRPLLLGFALCAGVITCFAQPAEPALLACIAVTLAIGAAGFAGLDIDRCVRRLHYGHVRNGRRDCASDKISRPAGDAGRMGQGG